MVKSRLFVSLFLLIIFSFPTWANNGSSGSAAAAFLKLGSGVRAPAMGGAFVAIADDASATFWNPAGLSQLSSKEVSTSYNMWLQGANYSTLNYIQPILPGQVLGISIFYLSYGDILETSATLRAGSGRTFSPSATVTTLSYSLKIRENLSLGVNLKIFNQSIDAYQENGSAIDAGVFLSDFYDMKLGLVLQNFGSINSASLPQIYKLGLSKNMLEEKLTIAFDINYPRDNNAFFCLGGEYKLNQFLVLRGGYNTRAEDGAGGNLGLGIGLNLFRFAVDYAYVPYSDLGNAHRAGLRFNI